MPFKNGHLLGDPDHGSIRLLSLVGPDLQQRGLWALEYSSIIYHPGSQAPPGCYPCIALRHDFDNDSDLHLECRPGFQLVLPLGG
jgi:hypothetical protein